MRGDHPKVTAFTDWLVNVLTAAVILAAAYVYLGIRGTISRLAPQRWGFPDGYKIRA